MKNLTKTLIASTAGILLLAGGGVAVAMNQPADEPVQKRTEVSVVEETAPTVEPSAEPTVEPAPVEAPAPAPVVEPAPAPAPPPPPAPIRCPAGSQANSGDGGNDTSCFPVICFTIVLPDPAHPECITAFKP